MSFINKLKGRNVALPSRPTLAKAMLAWFGGFLAISSVALLGDSLAVVLVLGSFGASCVLVFGFPDAPFSQPRNVVVGHTLSSAVGLVCLTFLGPEWWSMAIALGTAIALIIRTLGAAHGRVNKVAPCLGMRSTITTFFAPCLAPLRRCRHLSRPE